MTEIIDLSCYGKFNLIDENIFNNFSDIRPPTQLPVETSLHNYCPDCGIPMVLSSGEYECANCGQTLEYIGAAKDHDDTVSSSIRICTGSNKGRFYNIGGDYTKTQKKIILEQLNQNYSGFSGNTFPLNVLGEVATQYNRIQKMITEDDIDENGNVRGQKKFVRRGNIKDEVLAGLVYFECIRAGLVRKKRDIALFMRLPTNGFSRGEDILRNLQAEGKIDIPVGEEPIEGFVERYLEALNIEDDRYKNFIISLVEESERRKIGMNSQLSSKVVSAVWIIITQCGLKISAAQVEKACDNTKKNTFAKFAKLVFNHVGVFKHIFDEYKIPV